MSDSPIGDPTSTPAFLLVSFGGPEGPDEVLPFLENVVRGKNVPPQRLLEVARHYELFDGVSPINAQNRALLAAIVQEFNAHDLRLPVYWGNRNWHPLLADTVQQMADDGITHALALATSAFGSYPGCRQYLEDIERAQQTVGANAPRIDKLRLFFNHPGFIEAMAERTAAALGMVAAERRATTRLIYTAHSIPLGMAQASPYRQQLHEACRLVSERVGATAWDLAYQSRSGPPQQPWLAPDVRDHLRALHAQGGITDVVLVPLGFVCEHMETAYDLDVEVAALCDDLGLNMVRAAVAGGHPRFVRMIRELVEERLTAAPTRLALGALGPWPDACPGGCCPPG